MHAMLLVFVVHVHVCVCLTDTYMINVIVVFLSSLSVRRIDYD